MKEIVWRVRNGWVYLLGICLILGVVAVGLQDSPIEAASGSSSVGSSNDTKQGDIGESTQTTSSQEKVPTTQPTKISTKKKVTTYKYVATNVPSQTGAVTKSASSVQNTTVTPPLAPKDTMAVKITGLGTYTVEVKAGDTAFDVLKKAAAQNGFSLEYQVYSFGVMVSKIGATETKGTYYWALYYNGGYSSVGASDLAVKNKDVTEWRYESW